MADRPPPAPSLCLEAALGYQARGWPVVPLRPKTKRPLIAWEPLQHHCPSADTVRDWFSRWPKANIGIVTGTISGLVVLDIDPDHGGEESLTQLEADFGAVAQTLEVCTGGGGRHLYFAHPGEVMRNRASVRDGIDFRGDGGYIVAPPSIHPNGQPYRWVQGRAPDDRGPAALPAWLYRDTGSRTGRSLAEWRSLVRTGVPEGQRNATLASLTGHLLWHGVDADVVLELLLAWNQVRCRPPLDAAEVAQVVRNIHRLHVEEQAETEPAWPRGDRL